MSLLDMQNLLDTSAEEVENRPDFVNLEPGIYTEIYRGFKEAEKTAQKDSDKENGLKKGEKYNVVILNYEVQETIEGGNPQAPVKPGSLTSEQFMLRTKEDISSLKQRYAQILGVAQEELKGSMREIMQVAENTLVKSQITKNGDFSRRKVIESLGDAPAAE